MLLRFMVSQAAEHLKPVLEKSDSTRSRSGLGLRIDDSVIDRCGKLIRCTWSWYSGRWKRVVKGNDLLGVVLSVGGVALPVHLLFCSKQGRANTNKPDLLIKMLSELKDEFLRVGVDITELPLTMDSWFASDPLKLRLHALGFQRIVVAGKGNYVFEEDGKRRNASKWKKEDRYKEKQWGIDSPSYRMKAVSPTFGKLALLFYRKSTTRNYYLMDFSVKSLRGAEMWRIWKSHFIVECFWKILKSIFKVKSMRLRGDGLYAGLLIKVLSYLFVLRLKSDKSFFELSPTQIMRKLQREGDFRELADEHFHELISAL